MLTPQAEDKASSTICTSALHILEAGSFYNCVSRDFKLTYLKEGLVGWAFFTQMGKPKMVCVHANTHIYQTHPWPFGGMKYRQQWMRWSSRGPRFTRDSSFRYSSNLVSMWLRIGCQLQGKMTTTFLIYDKQINEPAMCVYVCVCVMYFVDGDKAKLFCCFSNQANTKHIKNSFNIFRTNKMDK